MMNLEFPAKEVSWEVVRNIANQLTNQLYTALEPERVNLEEAHVSFFPNGPERHVEIEEGAERRWVRTGQYGQDWMALREDEVRSITWVSWTSGNALEAIKQGAGRWFLRYVPSPTEPAYRGQYFSYYERPEEAENLPESYLRSEG